MGFLLRGAAATTTPNRALSEILALKFQSRGQCFPLGFLGLHSQPAAHKQGLSTFGEPSGTIDRFAQRSEAKVKLCCGETQAKIEGKTRRGAKGASRGGFPLPEPAT